MMMVMMMVKLMVMMMMKATTDGLVIIPFSFGRQAHMLQSCAALSTRVRDTSTATEEKNMMMTATTTLLTRCVSIRLYTKVQH